MAPQFNSHTDDPGNFLFKCPVIKLVILYVTSYFLFFLAKKIQNSRILRINALTRVRSFGNTQEFIQHSLEK